MKSKEFLELGRLLRKFAGPKLEIKKEVFNTQAKDEKPQLHLYGKKLVSLHNKKPQASYVAGIIQQKNFTGFYFMPIYSATAKYPIKNAELKKTLKGKTCFNIKTLDAEMIAELEKLLKQGIKDFTQQGLI